MKIPLNEHGQMLVDVRGAHVTMTHNGRTLLGTIRAVRREEGIRFLDVQHFNGEPWPVSPYLWSVDMLERTYQSEEA